MAENHSNAKLQQVFRFDGLHNRLGDPELPGCPPHDRLVARWVGRRNEQQATRITRKPGQAPRKALLDARGQGHRRGQPEPACELYRRQPARQLQQGKRVAMRLEHDSIQHVLIQESGQDGLQQRPRIAMSQGLDAKRRQSREFVAQLAGREHERDLLRQQAAGDECERACRRPIEPLRVIDDTQQWSLLRSLRQQAKGRQSHQERVRSLSGAQPEGDAERIALGIGQRRRSVEHRRAQLLKRRERELHLPLDADGAQNPHLPCLLDCPIEQRGLPDARLSMHRHHPAVAIARGIQQAAEHLVLTLAAEQLGSRRPRERPNVWRRTHLRQTA
jgi:hypothetical protein